MPRPANCIAVSAPRPVSGVRLCRALPTASLYAQFKQKASSEHHQFWLMNNERFKALGMSPQDYLLQHKEEFRRYSLFVWSSTLEEIWIYFSGPFRRQPQELPK